MQIWEFILKSINCQYNTSKQIHYHSIQFINSFALADQMSTIPKQTINKIMRTITQILQERVQKDIIVTRQLLNCLQNWIFNFRYFEINCRKHFKDTKRFLENLIKALHNLSQIEDLQYDVQFFLSQLLKNYLDQRQDDMFNFQLEDVIDTANEQLTLMSRESIYHTISCHESMKQQQKIVYEISKIEKEVLKEKKQQLLSAENSPSVSSSTQIQNNSKKGSTLQNSMNQIKKLVKKNSNFQTQDIIEHIPEFINNRYICFCLDSEKLLSFLIDGKSQIYAVMRDLNGKFIWKIRERSIDSPISKTVKSFDKFEEGFNLHLSPTHTAQTVQSSQEIPQKASSKAAIIAPDNKDKKIFQSQKPPPYNYLNETHKSEGNLLNLIKPNANNDEKRKISKDIPRPSKNDQLQKIIEQIIYFIHESIVQTENSVIIFFSIFQNISLLMFNFYQFNKQQSEFDQSGNSYSDSRSPVQQIIYFEHF